MELVYLACPYTHSDADVMRRRFEDINRIAATMFKTGVMVFSPISHCHPMAMQCGLPTDWTFWAEYDRLMVARCDRLVVVKLPGWQSSVGVAHEVEIARELGKPISYMDVYHGTMDHQS